MTEPLPPVDVTDLADDLATIRAAKTEIEKWKAVLGAATLKVMARMGDTETATIGGRPAATWTHGTRSTVDVARLREDMGALLAPYLRTTPTRTFKILD